MKTFSLFLFLSIPSICFAQNVQELYTVSWVIPAGQVDGVILKRQIGTNPVESWTFANPSVTSVRNYVSGPPGTQVCYTIVTYNLAGQTPSNADCVTLPTEAIPAMPPQATVNIQ